MEKHMESVILYALRYTSGPPAAILHPGTYFI